MYILIYHFAQADEIKLQGNISCIALCTGPYPDIAFCTGQFSLNHASITETGKVLTYIVDLRMFACEIGFFINFLTSFDVFSHIPTWCSMCSHICLMCSYLFDVCMFSYHMHCQCTTQSSSILFIV